MFMFDKLVEKGCAEIRILYQLSDWSSDNCCEWSRSLKSLEFFIELLVFIPRLNGSHMLERFDVFVKVTVWQKKIKWSALIKIDLQNLPDILFFALKLAKL